jgi:hypothetical protein
MHALMGAEFTATSMIGWIALAGIIVRNSILLVDFSIHEIQRGVSVEQAVIRACTTRTRPIMITALALVCGSSVIFTDPIFQGMAISLASGVMVSTILTLIVIPLGCMKASAALCEVAAAGYDGGNTPLPELADGPSCPAASPTVRGPSLLLVLWGKIASLLLMLFYAGRGIFRLLGGRLRRGKSAATPAAMEAAVAPQPVTQGQPSPGGEAAHAEAPKAGRDPGPAVGQAIPGKDSEDRGEDRGKDRPAAVKRAVRKAAVKKKPTPEKKPLTGEQASAGQKPAAKKKAVKKAAAKTQPALPRSAPGPGPVAEPASTEDELHTMPTPPGRKGGRRGIRLKVDNESGIE